MTRRLLVLALVLLAGSPAWAQSRGRSPKVTKTPKVVPHRGAVQQDPDLYEKVLKRACGRWKLDINLLKALMQVESRFDPGATSRTGAAGLGQFTGIGRQEIQRLAKMGRYGAAFKADPKILEELRVFDKDRAYQPVLCIEAAALYLQHLLRSYGQDPWAALTHYNAGGRMARVVQKHGFEEAKRQNLLNFSQAKTYAPKVMGYYKKFKAGWHPMGKRRKSSGTRRSGRRR